MSEKITCYSLENTFSGPYPYDRDSFYTEEIERHQAGIETKRAIAIVNIFLFNESGELIIQKRSNHKRHNPNLLDKSIGGHIQWGDQVDYTAMIETVQELQVPSIVIKEDDDFTKTYNVLKSYLATIAILKHIATKTLSLKKIINTQDISIWNKAFLYLGVYGGSIKNIDKEAKGVLFYNIDDLIVEMKENPQAFTDDLHTYIRLYEKEIRSFIDLITQKQ